MDCSYSTCVKTAFISVTMSNRKWQLSELTVSWNCHCSSHICIRHFTSHFSTCDHYTNTSIWCEMTPLCLHARSVCFVKLALQRVDCPDAYSIDGFNVIMFPCNSASTTRPHYGLTVYSKQPVLHSCQPVSLADSCGTVECALVQVAVKPFVILSVVCVYRRPSSDMSHFATAMLRLTSYLSTCQSASSNVTHHTVIMGDFNLDWFDHQTPASMSSLLPEYRQLVTQVTTDYASALDHVYTSIPADQIQCYVGESYFSDHKPVTVSIDLD